MTVDEMRDDYDWANAFVYAGAANSVGEPSVAPGGFSFDDISEIIASDEGANDGPSWIIAVLLKDGRFGFLTAGCDCTGWDCRAGGSAYVAVSYEQLCRFGMGDDDRARLCAPLATT